MPLGTVLLWLCTILTLIAVVAYVASAADRRKLPIARLAYYAMTTGVIMTSVYLMNLILRHDFNAQYVFAYSSKDLPLVYLVSAFWAGQEGSILLWALFAALIGVVLSAKSKDYEPWVMAFWNTVQAFLFAVLLAKSPFAQTASEMLARSPDGQGLNPLLQNFWIAIHPPMVYVGYAAMAVPAAFVLAGLIKRDYNTWSNRCLPWALFGWLTLGAGIILGSYWAYEVLGWGGYWAWDPVENASLVPWIAATALLHGMLVERYRGSMRRTNVALALLSFLLVIYATYLTRSGVLGDFSVHSFEASGTNAYLIGFLIFFTLLSIVLFAWRGKNAESKSWYGNLVSKEFAFFIAIISLSVLALLVLIGTSSPIITGVFAKKANAVDPSFYNLSSAPISIVLLIVLSLAPLLSWARRSEGETKSDNTRPAAVAIAVVACLAAAAVWLAFRGLNSAVMVAVGLVAGLALIVNIRAAYRFGGGNWRMLGGYLAHIGIALMFIGMVFSPSIQKAHTIVVPRGGKEVEKLGYRFSFIGPQDRPKGGVALRMKVSGEAGKPRWWLRWFPALGAKMLGKGESFVAEPVMRPTDNGLMRIPYIRKSFARDLYIAPVDLQTPEVVPAQKVTPEGREFLNATTPDGGATLQLMKMQVETKTVVVLVRQKGLRPVAVQLVQGQARQVGKYGLRFDGFHMPKEHGMGSGMQVGARIALAYPGIGSSAVVEVSIKKLIILLWIGSALALLGGVIAIIRRVGENRKILGAGEGEAPAA
ncbi:MAG: cytochrome c biogenesis protein CcsA [Armatimonadota bacterium]|nr:cytochrome c biogenesis protein CcsA [Armatimonadota bacterium]